MKAENRYLGEHLGNLSYHIYSLMTERKKLTEKLKNKKYNDRDRVVMYRDFSAKLNAKLNSIDKQVDKIKEYLPDEAINFARQIKESNTQVFSSDWRQRFKL